MDGQRRVTQSLSYRRRRALVWLAKCEPGVAVRRFARLGALAVLASGIGLGLVSGGHLNGTDHAGLPLSAVEKLGYSADAITVAGLVHHTPDDVLAAIGVRTGESLVWFSAGQAQGAIEKLNWVQSASVERRLPNQLLISVVERVPFAVWQTGSGYSVIDRGGIAMSGIGLDQLKGLPMITGEGANLAAPSLVDRLQNMPDLLIRMHAAARIGGRRWTIYLDDGLKILLPETDFDAALASLMDVDAKTGLLSKGIVSVDLRQAGRLVVTKADVPEEQDAKLLPAVSKH